MYKNYEKLLEKSNTTSYAVSKATGISQATLSDWKNGKSIPKADKLMKIAKFFGVPMEELLQEAKEA
jgi:transcriptional regulator with XRE-family HTH domain